MTSGPAARRAALMDQAGHDFLADAGLAGDQDLRVGARGALDVAWRISIASL